MPILDQQPRLTGHVDDLPASTHSDVTPFHWLMLGLHAARSRKVVVLAVFVLGIAATVAYYKTRKPMYRVYTTILAQRPQALPTSLRGLFDEVPTRSAWESIHRRENLVAIVRETLLSADASVPRQQPDLRRWIDRAPVVGRKADVAPGDPLDELVEILDKKLQINVIDGTITIQLDWRDPLQAHAIVQAALRNYLEERHLQEVTAVDEVLSVLRGRASTLRKELDAVQQESRRRPAPAIRVAPAPRQASDELVRLQTLLAAKQRAVQDVEEFRRRRLAELHAQLQQSLNTLSEAHPTVIAQRQEIAALSRESPQMESLREEERKARAQYSERLAKEGSPPMTLSAPVMTEQVANEEDSRVREARLAYEQMNERVGAAQVELDAVRAAFKYRYNVVWPPQVPREPYSPNALKILGMGLVAALGLAFLAGAVPDVIRGRVLLRWQVERGLELPVIGELDRK